MCRLVDERLGREDLQLDQRQSNCSCSIGRRPDQTMMRAWRAVSQTDARVQRHQGMGNHAEVRWLEAVLAEMMTLRMPMQPGQR